GCCQQIVASPRRILHCEEVSIFKDVAPYLSHNPATFWHYVCIESLGASGGCRHSSSQGIGDHPWTRRLFLTAEKHREICRPLMFVIPARLLAFDSRTSVRPAMFRDHPLRGRTWTKDERRSRRMLKEFGGTAGLNQRASRGGGYGRETGIIDL